MPCLKAATPPSRRLALRLFAASALAALAIAATCAPLHAQPSHAASAPQRSITIRMIDGKTGKQLTPDNYVIRLNHLNSVRNELLRLGDDGVGALSVPAGSTYLAVQGTYHTSLDIYINCDAGMERDTSTLHWYSIADILSTGVAAPNECYKGKYAEATHITARPGEFIFYVREIGWRDTHSD